MEKILARLDMIDEKLSVCYGHAQCLPPGLQEHAELVDRVQRLETLYVCSKNEEVDSVIEKMLDRKRLQFQQSSTTTSVGIDSEKEDGIIFSDRGVPVYDISGVTDKSAQTEDGIIFSDRGVPGYDICGVTDKSAQTDAPDNLCTVLHDAGKAEEYKQLIGEWIPIDVPEINDVVRVEVAFVDATVGVQLQLAKNTIGRIVHIDEEGDAEIHFPSLEALYPRERYRWVLASGFKNMRKHSSLATSTEVVPTCSGERLTETRCRAGATMRMPDDCSISGDEFRGHCM